MCLLSKEERPLVVVSIIGPYRSGKSFLINCVAGYDITKQSENMVLL